MLRSVFPPHPGFKFPACSNSGPGDRRGLTCLQFCSDRAALVSIEIFFHALIGGFETFFPTFLPFFLLSLLWFAFCSVACLPSSFVILGEPH